MLAPSIDFACETPAQAPSLDAEIAAQRAADDRAMALVARDPDVRAALFQLVDVAPACAGSADLAEHLGAFLAGVERPTASLTVASRAAVAPGTRLVAGRAATAAVRGMAGRFTVADAPERGRADAERLVRPPLRRAREVARISTSTWSRSAPAS